MARKTSKKKAEDIKQLYDKANNSHRHKWQYLMTKASDFFLGDQLTKVEERALEEAGMPSFIINRITPVIETMKYFVTSGNPAWKAVGAEGSDVDVAAVHSDIIDYAWYKSNGRSLFAQIVGDSLVKGVGYFHVDVDSDDDRGMGEVVFKRVDPFDVFPDPMSTDFLMRDAAYIIVRKNMSKTQLKNILPKFTRKIDKATGSPELRAYSSRASEDSEYITREDIGFEGYKKDGEQDEIIDFYECYMKEKKQFMNVFIQKPPNRQQMQEIQKQVQMELQNMAEEMSVQLAEQQTQMAQAVEEGKMIPERMELELKKAQEGIQQQLQQAEASLTERYVQQATIVENTVFRKEAFDAMSQNEQFMESVKDAIPFWETRVMLRCCAGDAFLYEYELPVSEYPIVPIVYQHAGTPYPQSAVSPLVGKQQEINKAHQIMIHNANLSSNLRWIYEEGSVPEDEWEQYSSSPGALLKYRQGFTPPTPIQPLPLNNAFYTITQQGKQDMEYLSGISPAMQGVQGEEHETYRGLLALDEFGTRRIKAWMQSIVEPALEHIGRVFTQVAQKTYTAHKVFRVVNPNNLDEEKIAEINIPVYNDFGKAVAKYNDYGVAAFDIRIVAGSTMPVNRWALIEEYFRWFQAGLIDDIAMLAETDIRGKENIIKRKSVYAQQQQQIASMEEALKDSEGTIETLERQLVQSGIKEKVEKGSKIVDKEIMDTQGQQKLLRGMLKNEFDAIRREAKASEKDKNNQEK
tara:strand:+ start:22 stop:2259 length:2238 start_codon:yes stop_codon:yes gene_type:complete